METTGLLTKDNAMGRIRKALAKCSPLKAAHDRLLLGALSTVGQVSPEILARLNYRAAWGRWPDFENPATYDEKLLWLNFNWRHPLKTECGDKYTMRKYAERQGFERLLPRLYGVYESAASIDFEDLPDRFVLKCSHGCKCNVFCSEKAGFDIAAARRNLSRWLATDYSTLCGELHYAAMNPRVICEEFLDEGTGRLPTDYKVYCFNGSPRWILCCSGRSPNDKGLLSVMDVNWNPVLLHRTDAGACMLPRPAALPELLYAATRLSVPFPFVRVDFYCIGNRVVLGEMTFTPNGCINRSYTQHGQQEIGRLIELPLRLV